jgi:tetratricopeptide (TPR) repeat protein
MRAFAALLLLVLAAGFWYLMRPAEPIRTLAVLPLTASGKGVGATPNEVLLLGLTDGLISRLEDDLVVRPTSSVLRYSDGAPVDPVAAGREQEVDAVLAWSLVDDGGRNTLKVRLVRVRDKLTLWQDSFEGPETGLAQMVDSAATAAAKELHHLGAVPAPAASAKPANRANDTAYQLYLRGRYFWNRRTVDGLSKSVEYFRQAIAADPNYAPAYAGLADSYALLASFSVEPGSSANADARSAALSAIQLDPTLAEPHASLGMIYFFTDWNLAAAEREFVRAIQLNPNYATAHHWYALDLAAMGRFPQALYEIQTAHRLDPLSLIIGTNVGWVEYLARDYPGAVRDLHRVLELDPNFVRARTRLGMVEMATGDQPGAIADLTKALALSGDEDPWVEGLLGDAEARNGNRKAAEQALVELRARSATHYVPPISRGLVLIGLGRLPEADAALARAVEDHSTSMVYARVDPSLDDVRNDPGFKALLSRVQP